MTSDDAEPTPPATGEDGASAPRDVEGLLEHADVGADSLELRAARASVRQRLFGPWEPELLVGRYTILQRVGAGGMGTVYAAFDPKLDRRVAIKLLNPGRESEEQQQRLLREAQAMARLSHPNVVAVHDVGSFEERVFIAMEFVDGTTLGRWLEEGTRSWREVVHAFTEAGRGLAAAHREGLVHRDFKPDNVLVDAEGRVKVTDFGLVRPVGGGVTLEDARRSSGSGIGSAGGRALDTPLTADGRTMGTPRYMSPEQHVGGTVDARSDQFSFCVALFDALYGRPPFEGPTPASLAASVTAGELRPPPRGHGVPRFLEGVIRRGLAVSPRERWPSMDALLTALDRDPSRARRRLAWGAVATTVVVAAGWLGAQELDERRDALERERAELSRQCEGAEEELEPIWGAARRERVHQAMLGASVGFAAATWERVGARADDYVERWIGVRHDACTRHQRGLLSAEAYDRQVECLALRRRELDALVEVLERGEVAAIERAPAAIGRLVPPSRCDDPARLAAELDVPRDPRLAEEVARIRGELAAAQGLSFAGEMDEAHQAASEARRDAESTGFSPLRATAAYQVGVLQDDLGRADDARASLEAAYYTGLGSSQDRVAAGSATLLARFAVDRADDEGFERWVQQAEALATRLGEPEPWALVHTVRGAHAIRAGEYEEALTSFQRARDTYLDAPGDHGSVLGDAHQNVGAAMFYLARYDEAAASMAEALATLEAIYGPDHPYLAHSLHNLGNVASVREQLDEAQASFERERSILEAAYGPEHPDLSVAHDGLGRIATMRGRFEEGQQHFERAVALVEAARGPDDPALLPGLINLGIAHLEIGSYAEGRRHVERAQRIVESSLGPEHPELMTVLSGLGNLMVEQGEVDEAVAVFERALRIGEASFGPDHEALADILANLGAALVARGRSAEAIGPTRRALELAERATGPEAMQAGILRTMLAQAHLANGERAEARDQARRSLEILAAAEAPTVNVAEARFTLARAVRDAEPGRAVELAKEARAEYARDHAPPRPAAQRAIDEIDHWLAER